MNGSTFPGRMISLVGAVCFGETTDTAGSADSAASALRVLRAFTRDQIPDNSTPTTTINAIARMIHDLRECFPAPASFGGTICRPIGRVFSVRDSVVRGSV